MHSVLMLISYDYWRRCNESIAYNLNYTREVSNRRLSTSASTTNNKNDDNVFIKNSVAVNW